MFVQLVRSVGTCSSKLTVRRGLGFAALLSLLLCLVGSAALAQTFSSTTSLGTVTVTANTGEKPQSKVWTYDGYWWAVLANSGGTYVYRLDGTSWTSVLQVSTATNTHADVKAVGAVSHILLYAGQSSQLVSVEYVSATHTYQMWSVRPGAVAITLDSGVETATIDIDSNGRMWLASDASTDINVRWADSPYSSWSSAITIATGISTDDIGVVTTLNTGKIGVLWSNQNTQRFGFRTHTDGADPSTWTADELPASQSALNVGLGMADDHLNVAVAADGTLYAAVKTSYDTGGYTKIALLVRRPAGTWDNLYEVDQSGTRAIVVLNEVKGTVTVVYTSTEGQGNIQYKQSNLSPISFGSVQTLLSGSYNESTSTKQNYSGNVVLLATNVPGNYVAGVLASQTTPLQDSLVGHWAMDEGSGTSLIDSSGYANAARLVGSPAWATSPYKGLALDIDGSSQYAVAPNSTSLNLTGTMTISAWIRPDVTGTQRIVKKFSTSPVNAGYELFLEGPSPYRVSFRFNNNTATRVNSTSAYPINGDWMHVAATWDGATVKMYINGVLEGSVASTVAPITCADSVGIGATGAGAEKFNGRLDDVRIYRRALSLSEVQTLASHSIVASAGSGGTVTPSGTVAVVNRANQSFTITADPGYAVTNVIVDGISQGALTAYTFSTVVMNHTLSASFAPVATTHTITATAGSNGSISPNGAVIVSDGGSQTFTITPNGGYQVAGVLVDGLPVGPVTSYTFSGVTTDHTISATFSVLPDLVARYAMEEGSGTILVDSSTYLNHGTIAGAPSWTTGPKGLALALNGSSQYGTVPDNNSLDITNAITLAAWVKPSQQNTQNIIKKAINTNTNGYELSLAAPSSTSGPNKAFVRFNQTTGGDAYRVNSTVDYPFDGATWWHIAATYDGDTIRLYVNGVLNNKLGASIAITANTLPVGIGVQSDGSSFKLMGQLDDARIYNRALTASEVLALATHTIVASAGSGGTISPSGSVTVTNLANQSFNIAANPGYQIQDVVVDGSSVGAVSSYTFSSVMASHTISASFSLLAASHTITATAGANGSIAPSGAVTVSHGANQTFSITANTGYHVDSVLVDGAKVDSSSSYTFTNVTADHTIRTVYAANVPVAAALQFNGSSQYVTFGSASGTDSLGVRAFTLECWLKINGAGVPTGTGTGGLSAAVPLITKGRGEGETPANLNMNYFFGISGNKLAADFEDSVNGGNHPINGVTTLATGTWYHAAVTYDGTTWKLYVNGQLDSSKSIGFIPEYRSIQHAGLATAMTSTGVGAGFFNGVLDEVRIWNYARTQSQIQSTINSELASAQSGLISRWGLNDGSGATALNTIAGRPNGTLMPALTLPAWVTPGAPFNIVYSPPNAPSGLAATAVSPYQISLTWSDNSSDESGFDVFRSTDGLTFDSLTTVAAGSNSFADSAVTSAAPYYYRVRARNSAGVSGFSNDASATTLTEGGTALQFGSASANVSFGAAPTLNSRVFTVETWFRRDGAGVGVTTGTGGITSAIPLVTKGTSETEDTTKDINYFLGIDASTGVLVADLERSPGSQNYPVSGTTPIVNGVWYHAAATYDGTTWKLYLNGLLDGSVTIGPGLYPTAHSIAPVAMGTSIRSDGTTKQGFFNGTLDETRIWNYARTQLEITSAANTQMTSWQTDLLARWGLNEGSGTTVHANAGTYVNGTIAGSGYAWVMGAPFNLTFNQPPAQPVLIAPSNGASGVATSPALTTTVSDPDGDNLAVSFYGRPLGTGADFTIVLLPDAQYYTGALNGGSNAIFKAQTQWIVNNKASKNIVFVSQLGDCTEHGDNSGNPVEWQRADTSMKIIEDPLTTGLPFGMPYGITVGNHDQSPIGTPDGGTTVFYNQYFGESRFAGRSYYGGHYGSNNDNHFQLFSASGMDFIMINLEYDTSPDGAILHWADSLLKTYSTRRALVASHWIINTGIPGSFGTQGQAIYDSLKDNPNLFLMVCGHVPGEGRRDDSFGGNTVYSILSDYQSRTNGGNGWLKTLEFSPANGVIHVKTYSPTLDQYETDSDSQYDLPYNMNGSTFQLIGSNAGVTSGSSTSLTWPNLAEASPYEWYATVTDGQYTTTGSTWNFTTGYNARTITASAGPNGSISPAGTVSVGYGGNQSFAISASTGYHIADVVVDGSSVGAVASYDFTNVTTSHTIEATFALNQYTITASAGPHGSITPSGGVLVSHGASQTFAIVPDTGYQIAEVVVDGVSQGTAGSYIFTNVTEPHTISASFAINSYMIDASAGPGGSIDPSGSINVMWSSSQTFTIAANLGYHILDVVVDGSSVGALSSYQFTDIDASHTIEASFALNQYTISATAGAHGSIDPAGAILVNHGADQTFTISADPGYHIASLVIDSTPTDTASTYTFASVVTSHSIHVDFAINQYAITTTVYGNGTISPDGVVLVNHGSNQAFTLEPGTGYQIADLVVDGVSHGATGSYTFENVTENHSIEAYFAIQGFTIVATAGPGGSISPNGSVPVIWGSNQTFTISPDPGYHIADVLVDGSSVGPLASYEFPDIKASHSIEASFAINTYTITVTAGPGGSISPSGPVTVTHGADQSFAIIPNEGYDIVDVLVDGVSQGPVPAYTFPAVSDHHSIEATFTLKGFTIVASAGSGGTIDPSGFVPVYWGSTPSFAMDASVGYHILDVTVDGISIGAVPTYTFDPVQASHSIHVEFAINQYPITTTVHGSGAINPGGVVLVNHGSDQSFSFEPGTGYQIADVVVDGVSQGVTSTYTFPNVTTDHTLEVFFALQGFTIVATAGPGGSINPNGDVPVLWGSNQSFTISPNVGYHIADVVVDGVSIGAVASYEFTDITASHSIEATFAINTYTITASAGPGGSITPSGAVTVSYGSDQTFGIAASTGYRIVDVVVDGVSKGAISNYSFTGVTDHHSIAATFALLQFTIQATAGSNGSIDPSGSVTVNYGSTPTFTMVPDPGYVVDDVVVDGVSVGSALTYTFSPIAAGHSIRATFKLGGVAPVITSTAPTSGRITELYTYDCNATGVPEPTFSLLASPLGMTINSSTGLIQWIPAVAGAFSVTVEARNSAGAVTQSFLIQVSCCSGTTGNVDLTSIIDVSDLSLLVNYLTMNPGPSLPCPDEANVDGTGIVDVSDLSLLVNYLTMNPPPSLPMCR